MTNIAGFWVRLAARLLDGLLVGMVVGTLIFVLQLDTGSQVVQTAESVMAMLYFVLVPVFLYGYTIAKRVLDIRIVKMDGSNVGLGTMVLREVLGGFLYTISSHEWNANGAFPNRVYTTSEAHFDNGSVETLHGVADWMVDRKSVV